MDEGFATYLWKGGTEYFWTNDKDHPQRQTHSEKREIDMGKIRLIFIFNKIFTIR